MKFKVTFVFLVDEEDETTALDTVVDDLDFGDAVDIQVTGATP